MARIRCVVAVGCTHPITQCGNFRRDLFFDGEDRQTYLAILAGHAADRHVRILGTWLMSNPIHLIAVPTRNGRPFGSKDFAAGLEAKLERVLEPRKRGRKPKRSDHGAEVGCAPASGLAVSAENGGDDAEFLIPNSSL